MLPLRKEAIKWSPELAYAVGLISTDGCLYNDGRHIDFTSKDVQLLKTFKKCLGLRNKIGFKSSGFSKKKYPHIQFGDIVFYKWLLKLGLTPHKNKTIGKLKIPNKYFFDFLRGSFDGDGSCYSYWDTRWKSSFMFYISFNSASKLHIDWLRKKIRRFIRVRGHITQNGNKNERQLKYAKKESKRIIQKMYYKENLPYLGRKYKKIIKILKIDLQETDSRASAGTGRQLGLRLQGEFSREGSSPSSPTIWARSQALSCKNLQKFGGVN